MSHTQKIRDILAANPAGLSCDAIHSKIGGSGARKRTLDLLYSMAKEVKRVAAPEGTFFVLKGKPGRKGALRRAGRRKANGGAAQGPLPTINIAEALAGLEQARILLTRLQQALA